jgi:L-seryl-tRNA(Ser) seleniumtransferase
LAAYSHRAAVAGARQAVGEARNGLVTDQIVDRAAEVAAGIDRSPHRAAINCSGTILNTGLGRSRLSRAVVEAIANVAASHSSLEIDLETGKRGDRQKPLASLLKELTSAQDAYVVNNNAGSVLLAVSTFASGGSVLLSRGQSVEIGGAFRMPDVIKAAGARLIDVGCTNKTRISDYSEAIEPDTRVLLRCHPSNFKITGFVEEPHPKEMADLAKKHRLVMIDDVGSGCLFDTAKLGLPYEPTLKESLKSGAHVVTASGDKLLGAPQAGMILGSTKHIAAVRRNPLARALRIDKLTAAGLEATLRLCADGKWDEIPTYRALSRSIEDIKAFGLRVVAAVGKGDLSDGTSEPGGGSLPGVRLPSMRIGFDPQIADRLRNAETPVIGYTEKGRFWLDLRTVEEHEFEPLVAELKRALA